MQVIAADARSRDHAYHQPLIATDLDDARTVAPAIRIIERGSAVIRLVHTFGIPFGGHVIWRTARLLRELEARAREDMENFVRSSGLDRARFRLLARHGNLRSVLLNEVESCPCDLIVLASRGGSACSRARERRLVARLRVVTRCDILVVEPANESRWQNEADLFAVGVW